MATPIFERRAYSNPHRTARMSDLMREEAAIRGNAEMEAARASGRMWENLGQQASGVMSDLAQIEMDKPKREAAKVAAAKIAQKEADDAAVKDVLRKSVDPETGRIDPKVASREVALIDPERAQTWWKAASDEDRAKIALAAQQTTKIAQSAGAVLALPGPLRQDAYSRLRAEAIEEGLGTDATIPTVYDEAWLRTTRDEALTVAQQVDEFHRAATRTETERHNRSMEENARLGKTADPAKAGSFEDYLGRVAKEKGKATADLTTKEIAAARQTFETAGRAPDRPPRPDDVSFAQRAAAERWKQSELRSAERVFDEELGRSMLTRTSPLRTPEDEQTFQAALKRLEDAKERIQLSFLEQVGSAEMPGARPLPNTPENQVPPQTQPGPPAGAGVPPQPMGDQQPTIGQVVTVRGQRVRITAVKPDGTFQGVPVP